MEIRTKTFYLKTLKFNNFLSLRRLLISLFSTIPFTFVSAQSNIGQISYKPFSVNIFEIVLFVLLLISIGLLIYFIILRKQSISKPGTEPSEPIPDNALLYTLIDSMPDRIYIKDRKSRFIAGNKHVANIMGSRSPKDLIGKTDFDFYAKDLAGEYFRDEQELMESGKSLINKEERGLDLQGNEITISTTKVPIRNDKNKIIGIVGIGRDITPQKLTEKTLILQQENLQEANTLLEERQEEIKQQSEELHSQSEYLVQMNQELEKLSLVASHTDNVIIIMDDQANIEWGNNVFKEHFGIEIDEHRNNHSINLREVSGNKEINEILKEIARTKKGVSYEGRNFNKARNEVWSQTTISPVLNEKNEIVKLIAIDSDISKLKGAELEINRQRDKIEKTSEELKKLNATKDKFFSIIAHDLKNPFHSIMGFSELLIRSYNSIEEDRKKEFLQLINDSSTSAYNLLENLLDWSRSQTNRIRFSPEIIGISQILQDNIHMHSVIAQNKEIEIEYSVPDQLTCYADANMVNTIVRNLLTNALKFTPKGGRINVTAFEEKKHITVNVSDSGIGMDKTGIEKLFKIDEFHNTAGTAGETGTGLGLIICNEFILKHNGTINVQSEVGKGSTFSFSLPLTKEVLN